MRPKNDSGFEQKHVLSHVERSQEVLKTVFLKTEATSQAVLKATFLECLQNCFGKFLVLVLVVTANHPNKVCTESIKTIAHITKRRRPRFQYMQNSVLLKNLVSWDNSNAGQCTKGSLRKNVQAKSEPAVGQKTRFITRKKIHLTN